MVTSDRITLLNDVKPFKSTWKVEVKVLHSWTQRSNYPGGDSLQFILADKTGVKIHCTCKRLFLARVKKLQVGQWRFIENVSVTPAAGKYRPTSHAYKLTIISNSNVTNSSLKNDDEFLSLTTFPEIMNGSLDSNILIDVTGQAIDIGDMQVVPVQGQVQITNAFDTSTLEINPPGFDVQDYIRLMPNNELALITDGREVVKPKGNKRQPDQWSIYPERTILDIIMATEIEKCIVTATVDAIDTDWAWYYLGCAKCHYKKVTDITNRDVVPVKHLWYCDTCHQSVTNVAPRFKIHLLLKDDTGETKVMLLDTVAEPILGVSAEVLLNGSLEEVEDPEDLPDQVTALIGKTFKFGVYVNKDSVDYGSHIFNVGKTWSADAIITRADDEDTGDTSTIVSSDRSSGLVSFVSIEYEDNTCLSSTPLSKRKGSSNEIDDLSSTSKKQCSKIIKVEKNTVEK
ncbi:uncharacterized protein LOC125582205 [Brassica napus]|uniref:uncharacterized protein LOC125582205 n=1 Tax=Brassica napus TaxID=3708 RepID=UPI0006AACD8D|nr:uncharacterized protein LOC125582205 [Brassica napus]